ncbi:SLAP domain-containing protein [Companilactobacillus hulinensis]|uniref:SLAP domain-containing protein n=1 Tax=Companilactobacillus hulinensis TaxID=2486007 RepID=UPI000F7A5FFA|nr:SLAP domain-containing protein [Companilactobacillus hulinensis]
MKKIKVIMVSSLLSVGTITSAVALDSMNVFSNDSLIENVQADTENGNIDGWMPDGELQKAIASALEVDVSDLTQELMNKRIPKNIDLSKVTDLEGIEHLQGLGKVGISKLPANYELLNNFDNPEKKYHILDRETANFDDLAVLKPGTGSLAIDAQNIRENTIEIDGSKIVINLSDYFGKSSGEIVRNSAFSLKIDDNNIEEKDFELKGNVLTIHNVTDYLRELVKTHTLRFVFEQSIFIFSTNVSGRTTIRLTQPFTIKPEILEPDPDDKGGTENPENPDGNGETENPEEPDGNGGTENSGNQNGNSIRDIEPTNIMTDKKSLDIYNLSGTKTGEKKLTKQTTDFVTDKINTVNGVEYYKLNNDDWVKVDDVKVFYFNDSYVQTHGDSIKDLTKFRNAGLVENRALEKMTNWYTDRYAYFQGEWHHRVATHEWVHDDHVLEYKKISGVVNATENAQLYNSKGKKSNRALKEGLTFITDKTATINGKLMYRVATDEWVSADSVTFK